jgi:hypothetical protein
MGSTWSQTACVTGMSKLRARDDLARTYRLRKSTEPVKRIFIGLKTGTFVPMVAAGIRWVTAPAVRQIASQDN